MSNENMWPWKGKIKDVKTALRANIAKEKAAKQLPAQLLEAEKGLIGIVPYDEALNDLSQEWITAQARIKILEELIQQNA